MHRRLSGWSPGATHRRCQHKPALVEKNHVGVTFPRRLHDLGEDDALPMCDGGLIAFARFLTRLLRRPSEDFVQKSSYMIMMERNTELSANEVGDAPGGPQIVGPTVRLGSLKEHAFELPLLGWI